MRLEDGFQHTHQFEKNFKELIAWIEEAETQIRSDLPELPAGLVRLPGTFQNFLEFE